MASKVDTSNLSVISEERSSARKHHDDEYESVYNNHKIKSAYAGGHKKKLHPLMLGPSRQNPGKIISLHSASKNNLSEFTQRIMSAKLLRVKQVQNQLTETQIQLNELINENRILRNLQKRQEGALKRYEGNHAELPQLIRAHNEEIRTLKANNKAIKAQLRESNTKLKEREAELENLRDSYNKLKKLSTEKNLLEREKLQKKVEELQEVIKEQEEKIQVLSRKVLLESKNYRHHLNIEVMKHKETQKDLHNALTMITKLESQLISRDKALPGGKTLFKRDNKNMMPVIANKSIDIQPKLGMSEDSFLSRDDGKRKSQMSDSPDSELELLNALGSSEDTSSPTQDIFPDINASKKYIRDIETSSKLEMLHLNNDHSSRSQKFKKTPLPKRNARISLDAQTSARLMAEKLNEDMETIEDLAQKVKATSSSSESRNRLSSLYKEVQESASKLEEEIIKQIPDEKLLEEANIESKEPEFRRSVPKRKLEEEKQNKRLFETSELDPDSDLTEAQQQKLESMSKTWNDIKSKIQEERMKAEEKMKELSKMSSVENKTKSESSDSESDKSNECDEPEEPINETDFQFDAKKELRFVNFTDDAYILQELEKTDKIFKKLKNESRKTPQKPPPSSNTDKKPKRNPTPKPQPKQPQQQDLKSFRTESKIEPKYLEEFQTEYQKQNLLKALKAIDVGKDPNHSSDDSEEADSKTATKKDKFYQKNGLKHVQRLSSGKSNNDLMTELFGTGHRLDKNENIKLEYGTVAGGND